MGGSVAYQHLHLHVLHTTCGSGQGPPILYNSFTLFLQNFYDVPCPIRYTLQPHAHAGSPKDGAGD